MQHHPPPQHGDGVIRNSKGAGEIGGGGGSSTKLLKGKLQEVNRNFQGVERVTRDTN